MPRIGMEVHRRKALIDATVETIHVRGFGDATMSEIARRAGVSGGLAHHYFGSKAGLLNATMRSLLLDLSKETQARMAKADGPRERLSAMIGASFPPTQFQPALISAWRHAPGFSSGPGPSNVGAVCISSAPFIQ